MRESPLPMSPMMVRPTLADLKTQTRRTCKPAMDAGLSYVVDIGNGTWGDEEGDIQFGCPYGRVGDHLWPREPWRAPASLDDLSGKQIAEKCLEAGYRKPWCPIEYVADGARNSEKDWREFGPHPSTTVPGRYRHARFMPRWAARMVLEITDVRVERLQSISTPDAIAEGVMTLGEQWINDHFIDHRERMAAALAGERSIPNLPSPRRLFEALWEQLNGIGSWKEDPWVRVISYKRLENA